MEIKYRFQKGQIVKNEELFVVLEEITNRLKNCDIEGTFLPEDEYSNFNICTENIDIYIVAE